jgi:hypothetical protein
MPKDRRKTSTTNYIKPRSLMAPLGRRPCSTHIQGFGKCPSCIWRALCAPADLIPPRILQLLNSCLHVLN